MYSLYFLNRRKEIVEMIISSSSLDQPSSSSMARLQFKLACIVSRHDEIKVSFDQLKSQIYIGLLQAEDVFTSLAVPLTNLVGLKTAEMTEEGRSSRIFINDLPSQVEDMLKRSFAEFHAQKKLPEQQQLLMRKLAQGTKTIDCIKGEPAIDEYYAWYLEVEMYSNQISEAVAASPVSQSFVVPGRVVVVRSHSNLEQARGILTWTSHGSPPRSNLSRDELLHPESSSEMSRRTGRGKSGKNSSDPARQVVCEQQYASIKKILKENKGANFLIMKKRLADTFHIYFEGLQGVVENHIIKPRDGYFRNYQIIANHDKWLMLRDDCIVVCYSMSGNGRFSQLPNLPPPGIDYPPMEAAATFNLDEGIFVLMWKSEELVKMLAYKRGKSGWDVISIPTASHMLDEYFVEYPHAQISGLHVHKDGGMVIAICSTNHIFYVNLEDGTVKCLPKIPIPCALNSHRITESGLIKDNNSGSLFYVGFKAEGEYICSELELDNEDVRSTSNISTFLIGRDLLMTEKTGFAVLCTSPDRASITNPCTREMVQGLKLFSVDHYGEHRVDSHIYFLTDGGQAFELGLFITQEFHKCSFAWISA